MSGVSESLHNASKKATPVGLVAGALTIGAGALLGSGVLLAATAGLAAAKLTQLVVRDGFSILALKSLPKTQAATRAQEIVKVSPNSAAYVPKRLLERKAFVKKLLPTAPQILSIASPACRGNAAFMKSAAQQNPEALQYATDALTNQSAFMQEMVAIDIHNLNYAHPNLLNNPAFMQALIDSSLVTANIALNQDKPEIVAILQEELAPLYQAILAHAGPDVLSDVAIMSRIAKLLPKEALRHAPKALRSEPQFMLPILQDDISLLAKADAAVLSRPAAMIPLAQQYPKDVEKVIRKRNIQRDLGVMAPIVINNPSLLADPTPGSFEETMLSNLLFMKEVCSVNPQALEYAPDAVFANVATMTAIAERHPQEAYAALMDYDPQTLLREHCPFMIHVINGMPSQDKKAFLKALPPTLLASTPENVTFMTSLIQKDPAVLGMLKEVAPLLYGRLCRSQPAMLAIAESHPRIAMQAAAYHVQKNEEFIQKIIAIDPSLFAECKPELKRDFVFIAACLHCNPAVFPHLDSRDRSDQDTLLSLLEATSPAFFEHVDPSLKGNKAFMKKVVAIHGDLFRYAPEKLRRDPEYVKSVLKSLSLEAAKALFPHLPETLRKNETFLRSIKQIDAARAAFMQDPVCIDVIRNAGFFSKLDFLPNFDLFHPLLERSENNAIIEMVLEHEDYLSTLDLRGKSPREKELLATLIGKKPSLIKKIQEPSAELIEMIALENYEVMYELCNDSPTEVAVIDSPAAKRQALYQELMGDIEFIKRVAEKQPLILKLVSSAFVAQHRVEITNILKKHQSMKHKLPTYQTLETLLQTLGSQASNRRSVNTAQVSGAVLRVTQGWLDWAEGELRECIRAHTRAVAVHTAAAGAALDAAGDAALAGKCDEAQKALEVAALALGSATEGCAAFKTVHDATVAAASRAPAVTTEALLCAAQDAVSALNCQKMIKREVQAMVNEAVRAADRVIALHEATEIKKQTDLFRDLANACGNGVYQYAHDSIRKRKYAGLRGVFQGGYVAR
jgi:hypothetical protein